MRKIFPRSRQLATSIAVALATLSIGSAHAAGLGRLTVQSALGQPLRAEVEVTSLSRDEAQSLSVKLASPDAFKQAGLDFAPALSSLRFNVDRRPDGRATVRITSAQPLNEPFVDLLLELNWATGKFVREYTFLLDPPEMKVARDAPMDAASTVVLPAAAAPTMPSVAPASSPAALAAAARASGAARSGPTTLAQANDAAPAPVQAPAARPAPAAATPAAASNVNGGSVDVRGGETLASIANRVKPANVTMDQAIIAIYRANPDAFFGSVHQLRSGATLTVPDAAAMSAIDSNAARAEIRAQMANFNQYKARLAASARPVESERAGQSSAGSVSGSVTDRSAPAVDSDQLKLSKSGAGAAGAGNSVASSDAERSVAAEAAAREAQSRVQELEKSVADLRRLLELKDKQMADLQASAAAARAKAPVATGSIAPSAPAPVLPATPPAASTPPVAAPTASAPPATPAVKEPAPAAQAPATPPAAPIAPPPTATAPAATPAIPIVPAPGAAADADTAKPVPTTPTASAPAPVAEPGLMDELTDNPLVLPGLAAVIALIAGSAWIAMRRRKKVEKFEDSLIAPDGFAANSLFGSTGGQTSVDTHNSLFTASRETTSDVHSTEVDPIAEAEVYIAYGREAQAEEILKEALKKQPERQAIRLKLMEIYAGRKDAKLFSAVAGDMYEMTGGQNEEWPKVVTLGLSLDPDNPLYTGKGSITADPAPVTASFDHTHTELPSLDPTPSPAASTSSAAAIGAGVSAAAAASLAARGADGKRNDDNSLDFPASIIPDEEVKTDEVAALDFDLDLDRALNEASTTKPTSNDGNSELSQAIDGRFELPSLDLPSRSATGLQSTTASTDTATLNDDLKIDLPALEDFDTRTARLPESAPAPAAMDLSAIGLDLQPSTMAPPPNADAARWQEMATKLDLASAYEEIGDNEGARELLQEVLKGGDGDQQQRAQLMLSKIS